MTTLNFDDLAPPQDGGALTFDDLSGGALTPTPRSYLARNLPDWLYDNVVQPAGKGAGTIYSRAADLLTRRDFSNRPATEERSDAEIEAELLEFDRTQRPQSGSPVFSPDVPMPQRIRAYRAMRAGERLEFDEEKSFWDSRGIRTRLGDTAVGAVSLPVRAITRGKYGIGDLAGDTTIGRDLSAAEQGFFRANEPYLKTLADVGGFLQGVPVLAGIDRSMSPRGLYHARNQAALRADESAPGPDAVRYANPAIRQARQQRELEAQRARAVADDSNARSTDALAAYERQGIDPFVPALATERTRSVARSIEGIPVLGNILSSRLNRTTREIEGRLTEATQRLQAAPTAEEAGGIVQGGVRRFRRADLEDLPEDDVIALGINPTRPVPIMNSRNRYVYVPDVETYSVRDHSPQQRRALASSGGLTSQSMRTRMEDLSPRDVRRILDAPESYVGFRQRSSALYRLFEDSIQPVMRAGRARQEVYATRHLARVLQEWQRTGSLSYKRTPFTQMTGPYRDTFRRIVNPQSNFTIPRLQALVTELGRDIASARGGNPDRASLPLQQLKALYSAAQDDLMAAVLALPARLQSRVGDPAYAGVNEATVTAANNAARYLGQARRYYRESMEDMQRFQDIVGASTEEQAIRKFTSYLRPNSQNLAALTAVENALRPAEMRSVLGYAINALGQRNGRFDLATFAEGWRGISARPRVRALFERVDQGHGGPPLAQTLDDLVAIADSLGAYQATPTSARGVVGLAGSATALSLLNPSSLFAIGGALAGTATAGRLFTSQVFLNRYVRPRLERAARGEPRNPREDARDLARVAELEPDRDLARLAFLASQQVLLDAENNKNAQKERPE